MTDTDFKEIGAKLKAAFRLSTRPLAIYGSEVLPASILPMTVVNRCFAVSMYRMATEMRYQRSMSVPTSVKTAASVGSTIWDIFRYLMISSILYRLAGKMFAAG
jgi:hypothetical protein